MHREELGTQDPAPDCISICAVDCCSRPQRKLRWKRLGGSSLFRLPGPELGHPWLHRSLSFMSSSLSSNGAAGSRLGQLPWLLHVASPARAEIRNGPNALRLKVKLVVICPERRPIRICWTAEPVARNCHSIIVSLPCPVSPQSQGW